MTTETLHATCIAIGGRAILLKGGSGAGKSDLALRLIDRGAQLVSDDYTCLRALAGRLLAAAPPRIAGRIEVRGIGILAMPAIGDVPVCLLVDLDGPVERLPDAGGHILVAGHSVPLVALSALEASAPIKVELALAQHGLPL